ncbi:MAG: hypothetical protein V3V00_03875 [Saprospiraceae bacterium]
MGTQYSGTSLSKKLGIKSGMNYMLHNAPDYYFQLFDDWPEATLLATKLKDESLDFIHLFCYNLEDLSTYYTTYKSSLKKGGSLWISWPKKNSNIKTDIDGNLVRAYILNNGLVDVKVAAINDTWSGLKAVYRLKDR